MIRVALFFFILLTSSPSLSQTLIYKGDLTWRGEGFSIKQENVILKKNFFWFFTKVELKSGRLSLIENDSDNRSIYLLREIKDSEKSVPFKESYLYSMSSSSVDAYQYIEKSLPLTIYYYTAGKSKGKIQEEERNKKYKLELSKWEKEKELAFEYHKQLIKALGYSLSTHPFYYDKPKPTRTLSYSLSLPEEEYYLTKKMSFDLELNRDYYSDLQGVYGDYKSEVLKSNAVNVFLVLAAITLIIVVVRLIVRFLCGFFSHICKKIRVIKDAKRNIDIARIAEEEAIREIVRSSVCESERDDLVAIRKKIADAIDRGDDDKLEYLLKIAERMKNT
ncbi:hypothetical protein [Plesiomonas shigelloides]|uniref:hypothetical protein n=1 Tax=Plesiomonas shigelloides TaxID=703 RepID=UPI001261B940|nr:hypothetical protein [Plesiomonas shigelloides]KAB7685092.1 hypothetical protein GBN28_16290 [Plesiomonas shigelloides]